MNYLWNEFRLTSVVHLFFALFFAAMPWMTGPFLVDAVVIFLVATVTRIIIMIVRTIILTVRNRSRNKG